MNNFITFEPYSQRKVTKKKTFRKIKFSFLKNKKSQDLLRFYISADFAEQCSIDETCRLVFACDADDLYVWQLKKVEKGYKVRKSKSGLLYEVSMQLPFNWIDKKIEQVKNKAIIQDESFGIIQFSVHDNFKYHILSLKGGCKNG